MKGKKVSRLRCVISLRHDMLLPEGRRKEASDEISDISRFVQRKTICYARYA